jgi:hypothetical protein
LTKPEIVPETPVTSPAESTVIWPAAVSWLSNDSKVNLYTVAFADAEAKTAAATAAASNILFISGIPLIRTRMIRVLDIGAGGESGLLQAAKVLPSDAES